MMSVWLILLIVLSLNWNRELIESITLMPCNILDTVNITDGILQPNQNIHFNGIEYPKEQYASWDFIMENGVRRSVQPHIRGCSCNLKPCIRFCCPFGSIHVYENGYDKCNRDKRASLFLDKIIDPSDGANNTKFIQQFGIVDQLPCKSVFSAAGEFNIAHNGDLQYDNDTFTQREYCLYVEMDRNKNDMELSLAMCSFPYSIDDGRRHIMIPIGMVLSVIFIIATLSVYGSIPKLRNLNGLCLMHYLSVLGTGFILIACVQINGWNEIHPVFCHIIGYLTYFAFISAFSWLNVINFDLWLNSVMIVLKTGLNSYGHTNCFLTWLTNRFKHFKEHKQLLLYMVHGYGTALLLVFVICIIDNLMSLPEEFQPNIGVNNCFINPWLPEFLYFYVPIGLIFTQNVMLFILTTINFNQVHQAAKRMTSQEDGTNLQIALSQNKDMFKLFLRLCVVDGVTWIMELLSFLISPNSLFFLITDVCNTLQGVFIFILFIMRRRVFRLIKERWNNDVRNKPFKEPNRTLETN